MRLWRWIKKWVRRLIITFYTVVGVVLVWVLGGLALGSLDWSGSEAIDFGNCQQISGTLLQKCTYNDGHTEVLNLSDMTGR